MRSGMKKDSSALARVRCEGVFCLALLTMACGGWRANAQAVEGFAWTDLRGETDRVGVVTKALEGEKYTALREIAVVSDEALVITASRPNPTARPDQDHYIVYSVDLKNASDKPVQLMTGTHLQFRDWLRFVRDGETELVATYDDCSDCRATTFLTAFYLDAKTRKWRARWPREVAGAPLFSAAPGNPGETDQAYALMVGADGRAVLATWSHFQQRKRGTGDDYLFEYDVDPASGLERSRQVLGSEAGPLRTRLCKAEGSVLDIAAGQDTASCKQVSRAGERRAPRHSARRRRVFTKPLVGESKPH